MVVRRWGTSRQRWGCRGRCAPYLRCRLVYQPPEPYEPANLTTHHLTLLSRNAFAITLTDDAAIAAAAITGDSRRPNTG